MEDPWGGLAVEEGARTLEGRVGSGPLLLVSEPPHAAEVPSLSCAHSTKAAALVGRRCSPGSERGWAKPAEIMRLPREKTG